MCCLLVADPPPALDPESLQALLDERTALHEEIEELYDGIVGERDDFMNFDEEVEDEDGDPAWLNVEDAVLARDLKKLASRTYVRQCQHIPDIISCFSGLHTR